MEHHFRPVRKLMTDRKMKEGEMPDNAKRIRGSIKKLMKRQLKGKGVEVQVGLAIFLVLVVVLYFLLR